MIISERIFELIQKRGMTQKEFSKRTGIAQSTISDWKRKHTNPISEKILIICETLDVTPEELLSGADISGTRSMKEDYLVIGKDTELGQMVEQYKSLNYESRKRLLGYLEALGDLQ